MLVMEYMDLGSLHDVLHNESFPLDGELILPILRDIAQGLRFLHVATPTIIHGDLKAHNVRLRSLAASFSFLYLTDFVPALVKGSCRQPIPRQGSRFWAFGQEVRGRNGNAVLDGPRVAEGRITKFTIFGCLFFRNYPF